MTYAERDERLRLIGFNTYADYLQSPLWANIRMGVLTHNRRCVVCRARATQVHHKNYSLPTLLGQRLGGLVAICGPCHKAIEFAPTGRKRSLAEANVCLRRATETPQKRSKTPPKANGSAKGQRLGNGWRCCAKCSKVNKRKVCKQCKREKKANQSAPKKAASIIQACAKCGAVKGLSLTGAPWCRACMLGRASGSSKKTYKC